MTSTVIVKAHCSPDKRVKVTLTDKVRDGFAGTMCLLKDGEEKELYVYDERTIEVREVQYDTEN